jgi:hypothetical protein
LLCQEVLICCAALKLSIEILVQKLYTDD